MHNLGIDPGEFNRRVVFEKLSIQRIREEPVRYYTEWKTKWVKIEEDAGSYGDVSGAPTASGSVVVTLYFDAEIADTTIKNYEAFRFRYQKEVPVYLTDLSGNILYDLNGFPMIQEEQESIQYYYLTGINEFDTYNRKMVFTAQRTR